MLKRSLLVGFCIILFFSCKPDRPLSTAKEITAFSFSTSSNASLSNDILGTIDGTTITATVPFGTDVKALKASFTTSGLTVTVTGTEQVSGTTANDFSNPVTYTVTAEDGSTKDYTVTVTVAKSTDKDISSFKFLKTNNTKLSSDITGTITDTSIAITVPFGTDVKAIAPAITITGVSVNPSSGAVVDFTSPVSYVVTAADSSTKTYLVTVTCSESEGLGYSIDSVFSTASNRLFFTSGKKLAEIVSGEAVILHEFTSNIACAAEETDDIILLAVGSDMIRYDLTENTTSVFYAAPASVSYFTLMGDMAVVDTSSPATRRCVRLSTGVAYSSVSLFYPSKIVTTAESRSRILWLTTGVIPVDIKYQDINMANGVLSSEGESDYHGGINSYPVLVSTPDGTRLIQGDGSVFTTDDVIERIAKLPYTFVDAEFYDGSLFILTEERQIIRLCAEAPYTFESLVGTISADDPLALAVCGTTLYAFADDESGFTHINSWTGADLGSPAADHDTEVNSNGSVLWSLARKIVSDSDSTLYYAGATVLGRLEGSDQAILRYFDQSITGLVLESEGVLLVTEGPRLWRYTALSETFDLLHELSDDSIVSLVKAGNYAVFFTSGDEYAYSVSLTSKGLIESKPTWYEYTYPVWSEVGGVIYAATTNVSPRDLYAIEFDTSTGMFGDIKDTYYHGDYPFNGPFRVASDGSRIFCADGNYFDGSLSFDSENFWLGTFEMPFKDMFITNDNIYILSEGAQLLSYSTTEPYTFDENITSITSVPRALAYGGGYAWILSDNATAAWVSYAKIVTLSAL